MHNILKGRQRIVFKVLISIYFVLTRQLVTDGSVRVQVLCLLLELKAGKQVQQSPNLLTQQLLSGIVLELISMVGLGFNPFIMTTG